MCQMNTDIAIPISDGVNLRVAEGTEDWMPVPFEQKLGDCNARIEYCSLMITACRDAQKKYQYVDVKVRLCHESLHVLEQAYALVRPQEEKENILARILHVTKDLIHALKTLRRIPFTACDELQHEIRHRSMQKEYLEMTVDDIQRVNKRRKKNLQLLNLHAIDR